MWQKFKERKFSIGQTDKRSLKVVSEIEPSVSGQPYLGPPSCNLLPIQNQIKFLESPFKDPFFVQVFGFFAGSFANIIILYNSE